MGVVSSHKELVVATVNYSGILHSPFEFYSEESWQEEEKLSSCFRKLLQQTHQSFDPKTFKWGLGKIDQKLQKERYAVIYRQEAGVESNKLVNQADFRSRWREEFVKARLAVHFEATPQEIKNAQNFDVQCYRTFIYYLYGQKNLDKAPELNPQKYKEFKKAFFSKSFLNENQKIKQLFEAMEQEEVDVFLVQESSKELQSMLKYKTELVTFKSENSGSLIVLRKSKFNKFHDTHKLLSHLNHDFVKGLNFNEDSSICFADNFIFLNVHLSSKKEKNQIQSKHLKEALEKLHEMFPMCQIIAGGDLNCYLSHDNLSKKFQIFPDNPDFFTTMKKRTWIQPQVNKADELNKQCKDSIISTLSLAKPRIVSILGVDYRKIKYIPNQDHPCDHFVVTANVVARV